MNSKLRRWFGGAVGLLLVGVLATCGNDGPTTGVGPTDESLSLSAGKGSGGAGGSWSTTTPGSGGGGGAPTAVPQDLVILTTTLYPDRATFDLANPGLPVEDFEDSNVAPAAVCTTFGAINSATNDACYSPGDVLPGLDLHSLGSPQMATLGDGFSLNPTTVVGPNLFADDMEITFAFDPCAVGFDLFSSAFGDITVAISVFDGNGALIGVFNRTSSVAGTFFGIASDEGISRIVFNATSLFEGELIDNIAFGVCLTGPGTCVGQVTSPGVTSFTFQGVTTFIGTDGSDIIGGTDHIDIVIAKGGDDTICTWQGPDVPDGGPDDDLIFGGSQADRMFGKEGHDHLLGEAGQDRLDGGHTPVPSSLPDTQPDICDGGLHQDRFFLCETIIDPPDLPKS